MLNEFISSMDLLAALFTVVYLGKLIVESKSGSDLLSPWCDVWSCEKRSLLNQQVRPKVLAA